MHYNCNILPISPTIDPTEHSLTISSFFPFHLPGTAPVVPYMPTLARQLGFSSVVVGTMYTILPIIGMLAKPTFGAIADRFQRQKLLFMIFQVGFNLLLLLLYIHIPSFPGPHPRLLPHHVHSGDSARVQSHVLLQPRCSCTQVLPSGE